MKENFKEQFKNLNKIILSNVTAIRGLVEQSKNLSTIIKDLSSSAGNEKATEALKDTHQKIADTIEELIIQTEKLFKVYDQLVEDILGKK